MPGILSHVEVDGENLFGFRVLIVAGYGLT